MTITSDASKKISSLWFYLFALFFGSLGIALLVKPDPTLSPLFRYVFGLVSLSVGLSFLLEPLHRTKRLPETLAKKYETFASQFGKTKGSRRTMSIVIFAATTFMLILFLSDRTLGAEWSSVRIYLVGWTAFLTVFFGVTSVILFLREFGPPMARQSKLLASMSVIHPGFQQGAVNNIRLMSNLFFSITLFAVGFFATLTIREGSVFGPIALVIMAMMSFGQSMVFGREASARAAAETELKAAHDMQMGLMPGADPTIRGFDISGTCLPAKEVGGDYFDYVWLDQKKTKLGIAIADVSGKAMKAAITAVMTSGMIYREIENDDTPRSILRNINRPMYLKTDRQVFTAMSFAVFDVNKKTLRFSNAGQSQPILLRGNEVSYIKVKGPRLPLGVVEKQDYVEVRLKLNSGDILLFYTDGLPEATNADHQLLGFEAVEQELVDRRGGSAAEIVRALTVLVNRHTGKTEQHDDMTVVVVKVM